MRATICLSFANSCISSNEYEKSPLKDVYVNVCLTTFARTFNYAISAGHRVRKHQMQNGAKKAKQKGISKYKKNHMRHIKMTRLLC